MRSTGLGLVVRAALISSTLGALSGSIVAADGGERFTRLRPFAVYDLNEKLVGLAYPDRYVQMTVGSNRYAVELMPVSGSLTQMTWYGGVFYFLTADCSGQAYAQMYNDRSMPRAIVAPTRQKLWLYPAEDALQFLRTGSKKPFDRDFCQAAGEELTLAALKAPIDITNRGYATPLHVK